MISYFRDTSIKSCVVKQDYGPKHTLLVKWYGFIHMWVKC